MSSRIRGYLGDARARWEDDALVVDTRHFSEKTNTAGRRPACTWWSATGAAIGGCATR